MPEKWFPFREHARIFVLLPGCISLRFIIIRLFTSQNILFSYELTPTFLAKVALPGSDAPVLVILFRLWPQYFHKPRVLGFSQVCITLSSVLICKYHCNTPCAARWKWWRNRQRHTQAGFLFLTSCELRNRV